MGKLAEWEEYTAMMVDSDDDRLPAKNFTWSEFECRCGCIMPIKYRSNMRAVASMLQRVFRDSLGVVYVTSGYRCAAHNKSVGGSSQSWHLQGLAADIKVKGKGEQFYSGEFLSGWLTRHKYVGLAEPGGVGTYAEFDHLLHADLRGYNTTWRRNK